MTVQRLDSNTAISIKDGEFVRFTFDSWKSSGIINSENAELTSLHRQKKRAKSALGRFLKLCWGKLAIPVSRAIILVNLNIIHSNIKIIMSKVMPTDLDRHQNVAIFNEDNMCDPNPHLITLRYFGDHIFNWVFYDLEVVRFSKSEITPLPDNSGNNFIPYFHHFHSF